MLTPSSFFHDPTDAIIELIDGIGEARRKELLIDAAPAKPPTVVVKHFVVEPPKGHTLTDEWDHRSFEVECNGGFAWLDKLSPLKRQLAEDSNLRVDFDEHYRIVKIVKKREAEFLQGEEQHFAVTSEGQRIPLNEETNSQFANSEDVFDREDVELVDISSEFSPPKDRWDLVFDATPFIQRLKQSKEKLQQMDVSKRKWVLDKMVQQLIYSADYFPHHSLKNPIKREDVAHLERLISSGTVSRASLFALCNPPTLKEVQEAETLLRKAQKMKPGKDRAELLLKVSDLKQQAFMITSRKSTRVARRLEVERQSLWAAKQEIRGSTPERREELLREIAETEALIHRINSWFKMKMRSGDFGDYTSEMSISDKKNLWELLTRLSVEKNGEAKVSRQRFKKLYLGVLYRRHWPKFMAEIDKAEVSKEEQDARVKVMKRALWKQVNVKANKIYGDK